METAVFKGTIGALRTIGGRKVIAVTVEVPIEEQSAVARIAEHGAWVAVARLTAEDSPKPVEKERRRWDQMSVAERAGIRCNERAFWEYLEYCSDGTLGFVEDVERAAEVLRKMFEVKSRKDIDPDKWEKFDNEYQMWVRASQ